MIKAVFIDFYGTVVHEDGEVIIVENRDTCDDNSPIVPLTPDQLVELAESV